MNGNTLCLRKEFGGISFKEIEAFNKALLAKHFWHLWKHDSSLVTRLLKARYYLNCEIFYTGLGSRLSYSSRSIFSAKSLVVRGLHWLAGDRASLNIWSSRWLSHPVSFRVISPRSNHTEATMVEDLIDKERCCWHEEMIRRMFLPCDVELILYVPLSYN